MLKELEDLGLLKKENGSIDEKTKIMLLHIYKCRYEKKKTDVEGVLHDIKSSQLNSYSQLVDDKIKGFFVDNFESGIERMHSELVKTGRENIEEERVKQYRAFANASDNMQKLQYFQDGYGKMCQINETMALKFLPTATRYLLSKQIIFDNEISEIGK